MSSSEKEHPQMDNFEKKLKRTIVALYRAAKKGLQHPINRYWMLLMKQLGYGYTLEPLDSIKLKDKFKGEVLHPIRRKSMKQIFNQTDEALHDIEQDFSSIAEYFAKIRSDDLGMTNVLDMPIQDMLSLYMLARLTEPNICVETGIAHGVSSTILLQVLVKSGSGTLHSIDLENKSNHGNYIPDDLRHSWMLHLQSNKPILPKVLEDCEQIDFFLHDSEHSRSQMLWEYETAWKYIKNGGILASHDILSSSAFEEFCARQKHEIKDFSVLGNFGFIVKYS